MCSEEIPLKMYSSVAGIGLLLSTAMEEDIKVIRKTQSQCKDVISILEDTIMFRLP
jgi:hypothetical protein